MTMKNKLLGLLNTIKGNGSFVTSGIGNFVLPGLKIQDVGEMRFPADPEQIKKIIAESKPAPYGKGSETLIDKSVRNVWEIDVERLAFENPAWKKYIKNVLKEVKSGLGLENIDVEMHLYKLLIYEKGGFFLSHKDSEKQQGMFGTLIIALPSQHTGGELKVRFDGMEETIDFSSVSNPYQTSYTAFFADCEHEILPVTSGHRIGLVYNLVQKPNSNIDLSPSYSVQARELSLLLKEVAPDFSGNPKAITLGHDYTPANFSLQALKGHDKPKALALLEAAKEAGYYAKLGLLTKYKMGEADYGDYGYDYYGRGSSECLGMLEVYEEDTYIEDWAEDELPGLGRIDFSGNNIISDHDLDAGEPTDEYEEGYTGNAGMTLEYWYHHGAMVIWPQNKHLDVINTLGMNEKLKWLDYYYQRLSEHSVEAIGIIGSLNGDDVKNEYDKKDYSVVVKTLTALKDDSMVRKYFPVLEGIFDQVDISSWVLLIDAFDTIIFRNFFNAILHTGNIDYTKTYLDIMKILAFGKGGRYTDFLKKELTHLPKGLSHIAPDNKDDKKIAFEIVKALLKLNTFYDKTTGEGLIRYLTSLSKRGYVNDVLVPNIINTGDFKKNSLAQALFRYCEDELIKRTEKKPVPLPDWCRPVPKSNNYKWVWSMLEQFLTSGIEDTYDYKAIKEKRLTVEAAVRNTAIDLKLETITKGSPHTLRLIKTQAAYERELKKWQTDTRLLEQLKNKVQRE